VLSELGWKRHTLGSFSGMNEADGTDPAGLELFVNFHYLFYIYIYIYTSFLFAGMYGMGNRA
jgi:hypothetical protein